MASNVDEEVRHVSATAVTANATCAHAVQPSAAVHFQQFMNFTPTVHQHQYLGELGAPEDERGDGLAISLQPYTNSETLDEKEIKKLKRKLNNRESARRSRQKKADEITRLSQLVEERELELEHSRRVVSKLRVHVEKLVKIVQDLGGSVDQEILEHLRTMEAQSTGAGEADP